MTEVPNAGSSEEKRHAILVRLEQMNDQKRGDPRTIRRLQDQYNETMDELRCQSLESIVDLLEILPPELSVRCLLESLPDRDCPRQLLDLTMVSKRWLEFIVSAQVLWVNIDIKASQHDAMATLALFVAFSGTRSIRLTIWGDPGEEWDHLKLLLLPHEQRISGIDMKHENNTNYSRFLVASKILRSFPNLPNSTEVNFGTFPYLQLDPLHLEEITASPDGYLIKGVDLPLSHLSDDSTVVGQFCSIMTRNSLEELGPILLSMTNLRSIWFRPQSRTANASSPSARLRGVPPLLDTLVFYQDFGHLASSLIVSAAATLQDLTLSVSYTQCSSLVRCLSAATNLRSLSVWMEGPSGDKFTVDLSTIIPVSCMTNLSLRGDDPRFGDKTDHTAYGGFIRACSVLYPAVRSFKMHVFDLHESYQPLRRYLESLKTLEDLSLQRVVTPDLNTPPIYLPYLKKLEAERDRLHLFIDAPNLEWISLHRQDESLESIIRGGSKFSFVRSAHIGAIQETTGFVKFLNHETLPALERLTLRVSQYRSSWQMPSLPYLRKLSLTLEEMLDQNITLLCLSFLYHPDHCPMLEEMELGGFPEWDILILMLERRNFRVDGTKRISILQLPIIPPILEDPLSFLLEGKYAERPSNGDISTEATREALCNSKRLGCIYCVKNMVLGCTIAVSSGNSFGMHQFYTGYPEPPLTLPPGVLEWLGGHAARTDRWKNQWSDFARTHSRQRACKRYQYPF